MKGRYSRVILPFKLGLFKFDYLSTTNAIFEPSFHSLFLIAPPLNNFRKAGSQKKFGIKPRTSRSQAYCARFGQEVMVHPLNFKDIRGTLDSWSRCSGYHGMQSLLSVSRCGNENEP